MICAENETTKKRDNGDGKVGSNNINTINRYETMKKKKWRRKVQQRSELKERREDEKNSIRMKHHVHLHLMYFKKVKHKIHKMEKTKITG